LSQTQTASFGKGPNAAGNVCNVGLPQWNSTVALSGASIDASVLARPIGRLESKILSQDVYGASHTHAIELQRWVELQKRIAKSTRKVRWNARCAQSAWHLQIGGPSSSSKILSRKNVLRTHMQYTKFELRQLVRETQVQVPTTNAPHQVLTFFFVVFLSR
jgi:hypothetical protein